MGSTRVPTAASWAWIAEHKDDCLLVYQRMNAGKTLIIALNMTPVPRESFRIGVMEHGTYQERLNSDALVYGGSGSGNLGQIESTPDSADGRPASIVVTLPPLAMLVLEKAD